jgi:hypothetical protein
MILLRAGVARIPIWIDVVSPTFGNEVEELRDIFHS